MFNGIHEESHFVAQLVFCRDHCQRLRFNVRLYYSALHFNTRHSTAQKTQYIHILYDSARLFLMCARQNQYILYIIYSNRIVHKILSQYDVSKNIRMQIATLLLIK